MKTATRIMAVITVITVALSSGAVLAVDPPITSQAPALQFELADGTVITGRIEAKAINFRIATGNVLKIPVADMKELTVGLNDRSGFVKRVEALVKALDSDKTREDARGKLIALGPAVAPIVKTHAASDVSARRAAIAEVLKAYKTWSADHPHAPKALARPLDPRSRVQADVNTFVGTVAAQKFRIASPYGPVTVKLDDIHRIRPTEARTVRATSRQFSLWGVKLRDGTYLRAAVISQSLRIRTCGGTMVVPFVQIQKATLAADGKSIRVGCWGSDQIVGAISPDTMISLKTAKGRVDLSAGKITMLTYGLSTFKGHTREVFTVAFSHDGKHMASGGPDKTIKLWDTATGRALRMLKGHSSSVCSVAFSPDGKRLASGNSDRTTKLWDTVTGKELLTLKGHSSEVFSVAFSPKGKLLASGSRDKTIKLWDTVTGKELLTLQGHSAIVRSVAFSPDGKRLASGSFDKTIKLWDTVTGQELLTLKGHSGYVNSVAFSPDGNRLASGNYDKTITIWDVPDWTEAAK